MAEDRNDKPGLEELGETVGKMAGPAATAAFTVAGTVLSSAFQTLGHWFAGPGAQLASRSFEERADCACRERFEACVGSAGRGVAETRPQPYENARPAYQFGHVARHNPESCGKQFDEVEAELQRAWQSAAQQSGSADWSRMREFVNYGYTSRVEGAPNPS